MYFNLSAENEEYIIINNNNINHNPVLCPHTNKTNEHVNILANLRVDSLLCRPTLIHYVPQSRLIKKTRRQAWPQFILCYICFFNGKYYSFFNGQIELQLV